MTVPLLDPSDGVDLDDPEQIARDLDVLAEQQRTLQLDHFDHDVAWALGTYARELAVQRGLPIIVDIYGRTAQLFFTALPGTSPTNADWLRRKRNVVALFEKSSYAVGRGLAARGTDLQRQQGLAARDYAPVGGCVPIVVRGAGIVGDIGISGLAERDDHILAVEVLSHVLT
jgi:uncharacterized protein (UPF0303 family)